MSLVTQLEETTALFAGLEPEELQTVIAAGKRVTVARGQAYCHKGDETASLCIIASGQFKVSRQIQDEQLQLAILGPGDTFGEVSMAARSARIADLTATEDSEIIEIGPDELDQVCSRHNAIAGKLWHNIAKMLAHRLSRTNNLVEEYFSINKRLVEDPEFLRFYSQL